jgi:hypothetical protein
VLGCLTSRQEALSSKASTIKENEEGGGEEEIKISGSLQTII